MAVVSGVVLYGCVAVAAASGKGDEVLLFSYFKGNGEDGLHLAYSRDGLQWKASEFAKKSTLN